MQTGEVLLKRRDVVRLLQLLLPVYLQVPHLGHSLLRGGDSDIFSLPCPRSSYDHTEEFPNGSQLQGVTQDSSDESQDPGILHVGLCAVGKKTQKGRQRDKKHLQPLPR